MTVDTRVELKYREDGTPVVAGYGVVFGGQDLEGDTFTPDTKFGALSDLPVFYDHAQRSEKALDNEIGRVLSVKADDKGLWVEAELDRHHEYTAAVLDLVGAGAVGWSSGAVSHLVRRDQKTIKRWPVAEFSLTVTPAEPRTIGVARVKTQATSGDLETAEGAAEGESQSAPDTSGEPVAAIEGVTNVEVTMTDEVQAVEAADNGAEVKALRAELDAVKAELAKPVKAAGFIVKDPTDQPESLKDFLLSVKSRNTKRLETVYGATKALNSETGAGGGYLVPTAFLNEFLMIAQQQSGVVNRVRRIPVQAQAGEVPALDQFTAPTTAGIGSSALAGKVTATKRAEGGAFTETTSGFDIVRYRINDAASGYVKVSKEMLADSAVSLEPLLRELIGTAVASKLEHYILNGTGAGEPLGILNAPARVDVTPDTNSTFAFSDAAEMLSRFRAVGAPASTVWIYHPSLFPDLAGMAAAASSPITWTTDLGGVPRQTLLGYQMIQSQHSPQADASGCIVLADLSAYLLFEKGGLYIDYSEHADFTNGNDIWRFGYRCDGQPWLKAAITLGGAGSAFTQSPIVAFND